LGAAVASSVFAVLGVSALLAFSLLLVPITEAAGSPLERVAVAARTGPSARDSYRPARFLHTRRNHQRRGVAPRARAAVVGGKLVSIEQVPWQVAVFAEIEGFKAKILCGGSIIDLSHIVTAAHCAINPFTEKPLAPSSFHVFAGASTITTKELKEGPTAQERPVAAVRIHRYFEYASSEGADDVAVLQLAEPLKATPAVKPIALTSSSSSPAEAASVSISGYGEENPITQELNEKLYSINMTLGFSRQCGGQADAVLLCGSSAGGSACSGDSGGGVTEGAPGTLVGVVDFGEGEPRCSAGSQNGFANLTAPEIRDFVNGSETPPRAPRGGGVVLRGFTTVGHLLSCEPGSWSNGPTFTYAFVNKQDGQLLQQGSLSTYLLSEADVGRTIYCEVYAANAGGTGVARTMPAPAVPPVPVTGPAGVPVPAAAVPPQETGNSAVLGATEVIISSAQIAALLRQELAPAGGAARIATLLKASGLRIKFKALEAGKALIRWYELPRGAGLANVTQAKPLLVASGQVSFSAAGSKSIEIKLTAIGRRLLKKSKRVGITAKGTFTPSGQGPVSVARVFVLKR
jgi:hypothetical protein